VADHLVVPVEGGGPGAWMIRTPCGANVTIDHGTPVRGVDIVLDPGHGGNEHGAVADSGLAEKTVNLAVAQAAQKDLAQRGYVVVLTRSGDQRVTLGSRAELALRAHAKGFVSIHHNSSPDGPRAGPGTETFYQFHSAASKRLAGLIYEEVVRALSQYANVAWVADTDAGAKWRLNDAGADYYGVLRRTAGVPAVIAELAYISNPPEAALIGRPDVEAVEGAAVARGIVRFLTTSDPGSGFTTPYPRTTPAGSGGGPTGCVDPPL
jgi:N-acetylmuramoyl-L-alanine amidase